MGGFAWVTLATNDSYSLGALVLANSLRNAGTANKLAVLITPAVSAPMREQLATIFDVVQVVDVLDSKDEANLALLKRPELGITFTKIHCWRLTQFEKCVFLDADTLVVRNCDELFEREEFSAAPDVGWPDCFNSGVFVFKPSIETFTQLIQFAVDKGSFDGGDQGLLNQFFNTWATDDIKKHLPFVYNLTSVAVYSYIPAFKQYGSETRIVHFIGPVKPWLQQVDPQTRTVLPTSDSSHLQPLLQQWWDLFCEKVHPGLSQNLEFSGLLPSSTPTVSSPDPSVDSAPEPIPAPSFPEPYTPYIESDDARQFNLPYQPFQVVSSEGELLNITFGDVARETDLQEQVATESVHQSPEEYHDESHDDPPNPPTPAFEPPQQEQQPDSQGDTHLEPPSDNRNEHDENKEFTDPEPQHHVHQPSFDYHSFHPDESCINAYLEHNVQEYQPYNHQTTYHVEESTQPPLTYEPPPLPRFLTIAENDPRQSGREPSPERWQPPPPQEHNQYQDQPGEKPWEQIQYHYTPPYQPSAPEPPRAPSPSLPSEPVPEPPPPISRSKSMSALMFDASNPDSFQALSNWKSQPEVSEVETPKKHVLPGLKPLLPKPMTPSSASVTPKYTEGSELHMVIEYSDPLGPPIDKIGFVEREIMKQFNSKKGKFSIPQGALDVQPPVSSFKEPPITALQPPLVPDINVDMDLSECKRQVGNKPREPERKNSDDLLVPPPTSSRKPLHRKSKKIRNRVSTPWKPPEVVERSHDVQEILFKLNEMSKGFVSSLPYEPRNIATEASAEFRSYATDRSEPAGKRLAVVGDIGPSSDEMPDSRNELFRGFPVQSESYLPKGSLPDYLHTDSKHALERSLQPKRPRSRTKRSAKLSPSSVKEKSSTSEPGKILLPKPGIIVSVPTPENTIEDPTIRLPWAAANEISPQLTMSVSSKGVSVTTQSSQITSKSNVPTGSLASKLPDSSDTSGKGTLETNYHSHDIPSPANAPEDCVQPTNGVPSHPIVSELPKKVLDSSKSDPKDISNQAQGNESLSIIGQQEGKEGADDGYTSLSIVADQRTKHVEGLNSSIQTIPYPGSIIPGDPSLKSEPVTNLNKFEDVQKLTDLEVGNKTYILDNEEEFTQNDDVIFSNIHHDVEVILKDRKVDYAPVVDESKTQVTDTIKTKGNLTANGHTINRTETDPFVKNGVQLGSEVTVDEVLTEEGSKVSSSENEKEKDSIKSVNISAKENLPEISGHENSESVIRVYEVSKEMSLENGNIPYGVREGIMDSAFEKEKKLASSMQTEDRLQGMDEILKEVSIEKGNVPQEREERHRDSVSETEKKSKSEDILTRAPEQFDASSGLVLTTSSSNVDKVTSEISVENGKYFHSDFQYKRCIVEEKANTDDKFSETLSDVSSTKKFVGEGTIDFSDGVTDLEMDSGLGVEAGRNASYSVQAVHEESKVEEVVQGCEKSLPEKMDCPEMDATLTGVDEIEEKEVVQEEIRRIDVEKDSGSSTSFSPISDITLTNSSSNKNVNSPEEGLDETELAESAIGFWGDVTSPSTSLSMVSDTGPSNNSLSIESMLATFGSEDPPFSGMKILDDLPLRSTTFQMPLTETESGGENVRGNVLHGINELQDRVVCYEDVLSDELRHSAIKEPIVSKKTVASGDVDSSSVGTPLELSPTSLPSYASVAKSSTPLVKAPERTIAPVPSTSKSSPTKKSNSQSSPTKKHNSPSKKVTLRKQIAKNIDTAPPTTSAKPTTPPITYDMKKKSDMTEKSKLDLPANRFELLPEEKATVSSESQKKKEKKRSKPSSKIPFPPLPLSPDSVNTFIVGEEPVLHIPEPDDTSGIAGAIAQLSLEPSSDPSAAGTSDAQAEYLRRQNWETGNIDYLGRDSFANIWSKISDTLSQGGSPPISYKEVVALRPVSLSMIFDSQTLDSDSIDTLPCDLSISPGEGADDDVIFDRIVEPSAGLPGILEEAEEIEESVCAFVPKSINIVGNNYTAMSGTDQTSAEVTLEDIGNKPTDASHSQFLALANSNSPESQSLDALSLLNASNTGGTGSGTNVIDGNPSQLEDDQNLLLSGRKDFLSSQNMQGRNPMVLYETSLIGDHQNLVEATASTQNPLVTDDSECPSDASSPVASPSLVTSGTLTFSLKPKESGVSGTLDMSGDESDASKKELPVDTTVCIQHEERAPLLSDVSLLSPQDDAKEAPLISELSEKIESNASEKYPKVEDEIIPVASTDITATNSAISGIISECVQSGTDLNNAETSSTFDKPPGTERTVNSLPSLSSEGMQKSVSKSISDTKKDSGELQTISTADQDEGKGGDLESIPLESSVPTVGLSQIKIDEPERNAQTPEALEENNSSKTTIEESPKELVIDGDLSPVIESPTAAEILEEVVKSGEVQKEALNATEYSDSQPLPIDEREVSFHEEITIPSAEPENKISQKDLLEERVETETFTEDSVKPAALNEPIAENLSGEKDSVDVQTNSGDHSAVPDTNIAIPEDLQKTDEAAVENLEKPVIFGSDSHSAFVPYKSISKEGDDSKKEDSVLQHQTSIDEGKEKKGVITKFLEFVGVVKKKEEPDNSSSVFYCDTTTSENEPNVSEEAQRVGDSDKSKSTTTPRLVLGKLPETQVTLATPPVSALDDLPKESIAKPNGEKKTALSCEVDANATRSTEGLTVDNVILDTPPVVEKTSPVLEKVVEASPSSSARIDRDSIRSEIDSIIAQAKLIAEDRQESESEPIYSNVTKKASKLVIVEPPPPPPPINRLQEFEEISVTAVENRKKTSGRPSSSKLSEQILKAIPPPRRKAISDSRKSEATNIDVVIEKPLRVIGQHPTPSPTLRLSCSPVGSIEAEIDTSTPPPVPPRRNRSKQRSPHVPQPPPKRKPKK